MLKNFIFLLCMLYAMSLPAAEHGVLSHSLSVNLSPDTGQIHVIDKIHIPTGSTHLPIRQFILNKNLRLLNSSVPLKPEIRSHILSDFGADAKAYRLQTPTKELLLEYSGQLNQQNSADEFPAVTDKGAYLSKGNLWFPVIKNELVIFEMSVTMPEDWLSMSQGKRTRNELVNEFRKDSWIEKQAQDDIYLLANQYHETNQEVAGINIMVMTHKTNKELATRYIDITAPYIKMYSDLLGPYPYEKFAVIEGLPGSGFGFPSFTMLGPRVIHLPFILYTSYPHEILHNWLANSVYVDYEKGNWAEGLTAYLSDHLMKEFRDQGVDYRRDTLQKYSNFVQTEKEFAIIDFRTRHNQASSAIGYGKTLMLFHMLRKQLGDDVFTKGLRILYEQYRFKLTSFSDVQNAFEEASGSKLDKFFKQWTNRVGAPKLAFKNIKQLEIKDKHVVSFELEQLGDIYALEIPIAFWQKKDGQLHIEKLSLNKRLEQYRFEFPQVISRIQLDPDFDIFRRLADSEIPAALAQAYGSPEIAVVLPSENDPAYQAFRNMAKSWQRDQSGNWRIYKADNLISLPTEKAVWILGKNNRFLRMFGKHLPTNFQVDKDKISIDGVTHSLQQHSFAGCHKEEQTLCVVMEMNSETVQHLTRKLPHYHKYGYLLFKDSEAMNIAKGSWPVKNSPFIYEFYKAKQRLDVLKPAPALAIPHF